MAIGTLPNQIVLIIFWCVVFFAGLPRPSWAQAPKPRAFYLAADTNYTLVDSVNDSLRFTLTRTLEGDSAGNQASISSFVDPEGKVMGWHDFGNLEGPGWAANA